MLNFALKYTFFTNITSMDKQNFVTIANLSKDEILYLISMAQEFEKHPNREILKGKVVATLFLSPAQGRACPLKPPPTVLVRVSLASPTLRSQVPLRARR